MKPRKTTMAVTVNGAIQSVRPLPTPIVDIAQLTLCPDFDDDCRDIVNPEVCMLGDAITAPICGVCLELQRRQMIRAR